MQPFIRNRLVAGEANSVLTKLQAIERLLNLPQLLVFVSVQTKRYSLFQRVLGLIFVADTICLRQALRLHAKASQRRRALLEQNLAIPVGLCLYCWRMFLAHSKGSAGTRQSSQTSFQNLPTCQPRSNIARINEFVPYRRR